MATAKQTVRGTEVPQKQSDKKKATTPEASTDSNLTSSEAPRTGVEAPTVERQDPHAKDEVHNGTYGEDPNSNLLEEKKSQVSEISDKSFENLAKEHGPKGSDVLSEMKTQKLKEPYAQPRPSRGMIKMDVKESDPGVVTNVKLSYASIYDHVLLTARERISSIKKQTIHESVNIEVSEKLDFQYTDVNECLQQSLFALETSCLYAVKALTR